MKTLRISVAPRILILFTVIPPAHMNAEVGLPVDNVIMQYAVHNDEQLSTHATEVSQGLKNRE